MKRLFQEKIKRKRAACRGHPFGEMRFTSAFNSPWAEKVAGNIRVVKNN
jgi:hypothetical protein